MAGLCTSLGWPHPGSVPSGHMGSKGANNLPVLLPMVSGPVRPSSMKNGVGGHMAQEMGEGRKRKK